MLLPLQLLLALIWPSPCLSSETVLEVLRLHSNQVLARFPSEELALRHVHEARDRLLSPSSPFYEKQNTFIVSLRDTADTEALKSRFSDGRFTTFYERHHQINIAPSRLLSLLEEIKEEVVEVIPVTETMKTSHAIAQGTHHCHDGEQRLIVQIAALTSSELNDLFVWMHGVAASEESSFRFTPSSHADLQHWIGVDVSSCASLTKIASVLAAQPEVLYVDIAG